MQFPCCRSRGKTTHIRTCSLLFVPYKPEIIFFESEFSHISQLVYIFFERLMFPLFFPLSVFHLYLTPSSSSSSSLLFSLFPSFALQRKQDPKAAAALTLHSCQSLSQFFDKTISKEMTNSFREGPSNFKSKQLRRSGTLTDAELQAAVQHESLALDRPDCGRH